MITGSSSAVPHARLAIPASAGLSRPRLLATLDRIRAQRLGMVIAPPGSGKTTLMAEWVRTTGMDVGWYRADAADAVAPGLVGPLAAALAGAGRAVVTGTTVEELAVGIERRDRPVLLVVDDLHLVFGTKAEENLEQLLLVAPANLHVLIGSRRMPSFNLAQTELPSPIVVSGEALRFRSWEVEQLFRDLYGAPLRPDDAAALARRTEGWAAALQLFQLSTTGRTPTERRRAVAALSGRARYAQDYLSRQVLSGLPEILQQFLRHTAVFDVLTGDRCDQLLDTTTGQRMLDELERRHALTTSDDDGLSFRYHEVLRRHLETSLREELGGAGARGWYHQAALILESEGSLVEALRAHARAEDWDSVRRLLHHDGARVLGEGPTGWSELLPRWLSDQDPWLQLAEARRLLDDGQFARADAAARRARTQFTEPVAGELCDSVVRVAGTWRETRPRPAAHWDDVLRAATRRGPADAAAHARELSGPLMPLVEGLALAMAGDVVESRRVLAGCADRPDPGPAGERAALCARLALALLDDPVGWAEAADAAVVQAERLGLTWVARLARAAAEPEDLAAHVAECDRRGDDWGAALAAAVQVLAAMHSGALELGGLDELVARFRALGAGTLEAWARGALALAATSAELPDAVVEAQAAESLARTAMVPGALALAYAALGAARPVQRAELWSLADSTATGAGLTCRPWAALPAAPPSMEAPAVTVRVFGGFSLRIGDREPDLSRVRPRARATLRLLALNAGRVVHRELIVDALWRDLDPEAATHNLHVTVSSLRALLEPGVGRGGSRLRGRRGEGYLLALPPGSACDVVSFDAALRSADRARVTGDTTAAATALRVALDAYAGELLPEDGPAEWVSATRERYRNRAATAARHLAELELARREPAAAVAAAQRSVQVDPNTDGGWRVLYRAHVAVGDLAAAERTHRSYVELLDSLGVPLDGAVPLQQTREPLHAVRHRGPDRGPDRRPDRRVTDAG
jgi:DNA-binding SARP family transcriptional activator